MTIKKTEGKNEPLTFAFLFAVLFSLCSWYLNLLKKFPKIILDLKTNIALISLGTIQAVVVLLLLNLLNG